MEAAIGPLIGAGTSLIGGMMQSDAAGKAAQIQADAIREGIKNQKEAREEMYEATAPLRGLSASTARQLAAQFGLPMGPFDDPTGKFSLPGLAGGPSLDPYQDPNRLKYTDVVKPYLSGLESITGKVAGITDMYADVDENGVPTYMNKLRGTFKTSPGYQFTRDEALRAFNQTAGGNIMGGGRLRGGTRIASGLAAQEWPNYIANIMAGSKMGLGGLAQEAGLLGSRATMETGAIENEDTRYRNYFARLAQAAGIGSPATERAAQLGIQSGADTSALLQNIGTAQARGIMGSSNALAGGFQNAANYLTGPGGPFSPYSTASSSGNANQYYGGSSNDQYLTGSSPSGGLDYGSGWVA